MRSLQEVIDVDTFVFNLTAANAAETDRPVYYKLYNHRENLKMENLYPADFDDLAKRLVQDQDLYADFKRYLLLQQQYVTIVGRESDLKKFLCLSSLVSTQPVFAPSSAAVRVHRLSGGE